MYERICGELTAIIEARRLISKILDDFRRENV